MKKYTAAIVFVVFAFLPILSFAQALGTCTFGKSSLPNYTETQCTDVGGVWDSQPDTSGGSSGGGWGTPVPNCSSNSDCSGGQTCQYTGPSGYTCAVVGTPAGGTGNGGSSTGAGNAGNGGSGTSAPGSNINSKLQNPFRTGTADNIPQLFQTIINNIIIPIGAVLAILAFIYAGFLYVTAAGDEKTIEKAHRALLYAAIGTAVLLGAGVIAQVIRATINQLQ